MIQYIGSSIEFSSSKNKFPSRKLKKRRKMLCLRAKSISAAFRRKEDKWEKVKWKINYTWGECNEAMRKKANSQAYTPKPGAHTKQYPNTFTSFSENLINILPSLRLNSISIIWQFIEVSKLWSNSKFLLFFYFYREMCETRIIIIIVGAVVIEWEEKQIFLGSSH